MAITSCGWATAHTRLVSRRSSRQMVQRSPSVKSQQTLHRRIFARKSRMAAASADASSSGARKMWKARRAAVFSPMPGNLPSSHTRRAIGPAALMEGLAPSLRLDLLGRGTEDFLRFANDGVLARFAFALVLLGLRRFGFAADLRAEKNVLVLAAAQLQHEAGGAASDLRKNTLDFDSPFGGLILRQLLVEQQCDLSTFPRCDLGVIERGSDSRAMAERFADAAPNRGDVRFRPSGCRDARRGRRCRRCAWRRWRRLREDRCGRWDRCKSRAWIRAAGRGCRDRA